jgi:hypothetical protein
MRSFLEMLLACVKQWGLFFTHFDEIYSAFFFVSMLYVQVIVIKYLRQ